ncbi:MAG: hypothetical protein COA43_05430 [Robiginitomaculum sp.]|nr:MAG: hypothetical protein COA43_05430 [Robiginitomaculum sp.]
MIVHQQFPLKSSIILLSALICTSLSSAPALAVPKGSNTSQCSGTKTTERKDGKDQSGNTLSCEWDKCTTLSCSSGGNTLNNCVSKTEYSNPRNCTNVSATGTSPVRGRNRVRGTEQQISAPVTRPTVTRPTVTRPSGQNQSSASGQTIIMERGGSKGDSKGHFDEADSIFGKRTYVRKNSQKLGKKTRTKSLGAPSNLTISKIGTDKLTLSWQDNATREFGVALYRMKPGPTSRQYVKQPSWKYIGTFQERMSSNVTGKGKRSDWDGGLTPDTKYCYRIQAYFGFDKSEISSFSNTVCAHTKTSPRNVTAAQTSKTVAAQTRNVARAQTRNIARAQTKNAATSQECGIKFGGNGKDSPWVKLKNNKVTRTNDIGGPWSFIRKTYGPCSFTVYNGKDFKGKKARYGTDISMRVRTGLVGGKKGGWRTRSVIIRPARETLCKIVMAIPMSSDGSWGRGEVIAPQTFYGPARHVDIGGSDFVMKTSGNCTFTLYNRDNFNGRVAMFHRVSSKMRFGWRARSLEIKSR